ncbi:lysozyme inhibitor LprI family protein [Xanthomonas tesorieronis]|uniref:lysozyme inhibitor LprI family protein n=1 Tax=Xanthomonas tesorieronis TaxID=3160839 RepID=UPI003513420D
MDRKHGLRASALALTLAWISTAGAVSFDCAKASSAVERLLCTDQRLDAADEWLARRYAALLAAVPTAQRQAVRRAQQAWLAQRDSCWPSPIRAPA